MDKREIIQIVIKLSDCFMKNTIPIWHKTNLTLEEAATYSGIGINKLRAMSNSESCKFVLWVGSKRLIKRKQLDEYLADAYSI